jgi:acetylglutamate kinase
MKEMKEEKKKGDKADRQQPLVFKYGGNAMTDETIQSEILEMICRIKAEGQLVVIVHGGGPFIKVALEKEKIASKFIDGQRFTSGKAIVSIEKVLKGQVNSRLVEIINTKGQNAVGLSGKDGQITIAKRRYGSPGDAKNAKPIDLGFVGDIDRVNTDLLWLLMDNGYIPVITCLAADENGITYNVNADVFAGHIAGALCAKEFLLLTDVDGLMKDIHDKDSLISELTTGEIPGLIENGIIKGGMIPKLEACMVALNKGANRVRILNGTKPEQLLALMGNQHVGTTVRQDGN